MTKYSLISNLLIIFGAIAGILNCFYVKYNPEIMLTPTGAYHDGLIAGIAGGMFLCGWILRFVELDK
jgi:hypothetical protein